MTLIKQLCNISLKGTIFERSGLACLLIMLAGVIGTIAVSDLAFSCEAAISAMSGVQAVTFIAIVVVMELCSITLAATGAGLISEFHPA